MIEDKPATVSDLIVAPVTQMGRIFQLLLLTTSLWAVLYARHILGPLQETMRIDLAFSDNQMALLQGPAVSVPMALLAIPMGLLVDRYLRTRLIFFSTGLALMASVLTALTANLGLLVLARGLV